MRDSFTTILEEALDAPFIFGQSGQLEVCNRAAGTGR
jgi:hypothetical protein